MSPHGSQLQSTRFYIERWHEGDRQALGTLWERFTPLLEHRVRNHREWPALSACGVEDVAQEVWARIISAPAESFEAEGPGSFVAWLGKVTDRTVTDLVRRRNALKRGGGAREDELDSRAASGDRAVPGQPRDLGPGAQARVADFERLAAETLNERELKAWTWIAILGFTTEEVAFGLATTPGAVRNLLRRSRLKLADRLGGQGATSFDQARKRD
jgi:RNA polymerase sigma factor (sigma-70 family)